jgi:fused signal recognition particle receptor
MGLFDRVKQAFQKTREAFSDKIVNVFRPGRKLDDELLGELEEVLLTADVGLDTSDLLISRLVDANKEDGGRTPADVLMRRMLTKWLEQSQGPDVPDGHPHVVLVVGVNGTGKTTTIGKLASYYQNLGKSVLLAAGDTFRAAAIEQLQIWGDRTGTKVIAATPGADSAAVAYDALEAAVNRGADVLIIDTAGRLHTKSNLMKELEKIYRVLRKRLPEAPNEVLLVLDATTGQNGISQAEEFTKAAGITGLVLTKIDGTAKGGIILTVSRRLGVPIRYVGFGEGIDDLAPFNADKFAEGLLGDFAIVTAEG